jgi:hypothetical protein
MTGHDGSDGEMVNYPWLTRPDVRALDALLSRDASREDAPARLRPVADVLAALQAPPAAHEHAAWPQALATFRELPGLPEPEVPRGHRVTRGHRGAREPRPRLAARLAAVAAAFAVVVLAGGVAAAYTGHLPAALQKIAHRVLAAPSPRPARPAPATTGPNVTGPNVTGPNVTGSAAYGLCNAYLHGNASQQATAFRRLAETAGGADKVPSFCASVPHPGTSTAPGQEQSHGQGNANGQTKNPPASATQPAHHGKPSTDPGQGNKPSTNPGQGNKPSTNPGHGKK